ncbi:TonB-dependent receptor [Pelagicoccus sp. SDUM812002]|uniref:TonB-dependent siderophore receptor n=1 Tax=Pelagicoccus sp. SDUM812002 TaxID=3041266 RepID=UPI00280D3566|nr:TonB-dependent receptor [Pelagicoccus sp. SDUM812002]MDQ8186753.1 TonB-dependent receptor [Pelagicoccus sp. SDUM812002]
MKLSPLENIAPRGSTLGAAVVGSMIAALAATPVYAQEGEEEVFNLSPFSVTSTDESGYSAAESITGSRIRTRIAELPYSVNVVTNEFLEDFNADSLDDQFAYVSSFAGDEVEGWYQLRGFKQQNQLRNGFSRLGLIDRVTVSRAEVIKGPAAGSYGKINPGGIINIVTKVPSATPEQEASIELGTGDYKRIALGTTGKITEDEKWLYRFDTSWLDRNDFAHTGRDQTAFSGVLEFNPTEKTKITLEKEYLERSQNRGRGLLPIRDDQQPDDSEYLRLATELHDFSFLGPGDLNERDIDTTDLRISHQFSDTLSIRAAFNKYDRYYDQYTGYPGEVRIRLGDRTLDDITPEVVMEEGVIRDVDPRDYQIWERGESFQVDLLKEYNTDAFEGRFLVTFDKNEQRDVRYRLRLNRNTTPEQIAALEDRFGIEINHKELRRNSFFNSANNTDARTYLVSDPDYSWLDDSSRELLNDVEAGIGEVEVNSDRIVDVQGIYVANQLKMLDGDLNINLGVRFDEVTTDAANQVWGLTDPSLGAALSNEKTSQETYQFGVNYRLVEGLLAYANTSTSFNPSRDTNDRDPLTGELLPAIQIFEAEQGEGYEFGLKADGLDGKLSFTLAYFSIDREDVVISQSGTDSDGFDFTYKSQNGLETASGYEFDFNYNFNREFSISGGIGFIDSEIVESSDPANARGPILEGLPVAEIPDYSANVVMKYGSGDGMFYTLGIRNVGDSRFSNSDRGRWKLYQEGYTVVEGGVGYKWGEGAKQTLQLTVKNAFDEEYTRAAAKRGDPQRLILRYRIKM